MRAENYMRNKCQDRRTASEQRFVLVLLVPLPLGFDVGFQFFHRHIRCTISIFRYHTFVFLSSFVNNVINLKSAIITSKDKLEVLKYVDNPIWWYVQKPYSNCGNYGLGSGYRHDSITYKAALKILEVDTPNLAVISFREPDFSAHKQDYESYIKGIQEVDGYIGGIWDFLQKNVEYSEKTTLIITNDHGRHLDTVSNGFISHGDNCQGCQRLMFMASGPDFKAGIVDTISREQIDLAPTISYLLGLSNIEYKGSIMDELLKE